MCTPSNLDTRSISQAARTQHTRQSPTRRSINFANIYSNTRQGVPSRCGHMWMGPHQRGEPTCKLGEPRVSKIPSRESNRERLVLVESKVQKTWFSHKMAIDGVIMRKRTRLCTPSLANSDWYKQRSRPSNERKKLISYLMSVFDFRETHRRQITQADSCAARRRRTR